MPEAANLVASADTLAEASLYKEAIAAYSKAIELSPTAPTYYIKRLHPETSLTHHSSTAYQRSGNLDLALKVILCV
jgi:tetratricopeptide (TPR) repeat protein